MKRLNSNFRKKWTFRFQISAVLDLSVVIEELFLENGFLSLSINSYLIVTSYLDNNSNESVSLTIFPYVLFVNPIYELIFFQKSLRISIFLLIYSHYKSNLNLVISHQIYIDISPEIKFFSLKIFWKTYYDYNKRICYA